MKITVVGTGYVGLVSGTCFAEFGVTAVCIDNNKEKIKIYEQPGFGLVENLEKGFPIKSTFFWCFT